MRLVDFDVNRQYICVCGCVRVWECGECGECVRVRVRARELPAACCTDERPRIFTGFTYAHFVIAHSHMNTKTSWPNAAEYMNFLTENPKQTQSAATAFLKGRPLKF